MSTGNVDDVNAPRAMKNVVQEVMDYVLERTDITRLNEAGTPVHFEVYDAALRAIWPELHKASPEAHLRVAVSIYIEIADRWNFSGMVPEVLRELNL